MMWKRQRRARAEIRDVIARYKWCGDFRDELARVDGASSDSGQVGVSS